MASTLEYLDISAEIIPCEKFYVLDNVSLLLKFRRNTQGERTFFTVEMYDPSGGEFLYSNKLVYGQNVVDTLLAPTKQKMIPLNINVIAGLKGNREISDRTLGEEIVVMTDIVET